MRKKAGNWLALLLVFAYLFVEGCAVCCRLRLEKEM